MPPFQKIMLFACWWIEWLLNVVPPIFLAKAKEILPIVVGSCINDMGKVDRLLCLNRKSIEYHNDKIVIDVPDHLDKDGFIL